ncbi:MAG: hypothetical protein VW338_00950 [Rhodospirillaceae bacterium]
MPNRSKGPRLYLRRARTDRAGRTRAALWFIRDGRHSRSTGCGEKDRDGAEAALRAWLDEKHFAAAARGHRRPAEIALADVLALYARDVVPRLADPREAARRLDRLLDHFGMMRLSDITGAACRAYAAARRRPQAARRELEDLRAAINHHRAEGLCSEIVAVALPDRAEPRDRFLSRSEAAAAIWAAWRYRERQRRRGTDRRTRRHVARLILIGLYTGTRPGAILAAALRPEAGRPWFDLDRGVFYRRPAGRRETKKRQPPVPVPDRLLAHLRRWKRLGQRYAVEWSGAPVTEIRHAFAAVMEEAGLAGVTPHTLRHTAVTWAMLAGADLYQAGRFFGLTVDMLERVYGHHHPEHLAGMKRLMNDGGRAPPSRHFPVNETRRSASEADKKPRKRLGS